jgi:hypothetical protein
MSGKSGNLPALLLRAGTTTGHWNLEPGTENAEPNRAEIGAGHAGQKSNPLAGAWTGTEIQCQKMRNKIALTVRMRQDRTELRACDKTEPKLGAPKQEQ